MIVTIAPQPHLDNTYSVAIDGIQLAATFHTESDTGATEIVLMAAQLIERVHFDDIMEPE